jgi:CheY-like chemotaxis protein
MVPINILVVDDHRDSADLLARLLRREGHQVTTAYSKIDALVAAARFSTLDVLLCDISLSDGTGCDVLRELHDRRNGAPRLAVALTGHGEKAWEDECRRAGFTQFLLKPVAFAQVLAVLAYVPTPAPRTGAPIASPQAMF